MTGDPGLRADPGCSLVAVTWNLHGRARPDLAAVAGELARAGPDVVALQEVQRSQARSLAQRLGWSWTWGFKHWPVVARAEGAALLSPHRLGSASTLVLRRAAPVRWQRRIALAAECLVGGRAVQVVSVHLSPHGPAERRRAELERLERRLGTRPTLLLGDLNPGRPGELDKWSEERGWIDCWAAAGPRRRGDGGTFPATGGRLDYALASSGLDVVGADVPSDRSPALAALSDHLPLTVRLRFR